MKSKVKASIIFLVLFLSCTYTFSVYAQSVNYSFGISQKKKIASFDFKEIPFGKPSEKIIPWMLNYGGYALVNGKVINMTIEGYPCEVIQKIPFENGNQPGFSINIHTDGDWKSISKTFKNIMKSCNRGKAKRTRYVASDNELFAEYIAPDYTLTIEGKHTSDSECIIELDYNDKLDLVDFNSGDMRPALSSSAVQSVDSLFNREWITANAHDLRISISGEVVKNDIGKYFKLFIYLGNSTNSAVEFSPNMIEVVANPVLSKADMLKKVAARQETIKKTYQAFHDSDVRASLASRGMYQVSKQNNMPELETVGMIGADIECNYLQNFNLEPNKALYGFVCIPYEDCRSLDITIPIDNQKFNFKWALQN
ncbi:MAG: hypothetical protein K2J74_07315 [Muribaculaceae bacterium]|nr:hypothetical protein [Muribaculaceae bacterium]